MSLFARVLLSPLLAKLQLGGRRLPVVEGGMYLLRDGDPTVHPQLEPAADGDAEPEEECPTCVGPQQWLLFDEAAELVGRAATRRLLVLSPEVYIDLVRRSLI